MWLVELVVRMLSLQDPNGLLRDADFALRDLTVVVCDLGVFADVAVGSGHRGERVAYLY
jgi:hypothetical protein